MVIIGAEWCKARRKDDPTMKRLIKEYRNKLDFAVPDVTEEEAEAKSYRKAQLLSSVGFFEKNKGRASYCCNSYRQKKRRERRS